MAHGFSVYSWDDVLSEKFAGTILKRTDTPGDFSGSALTVGGFDGVHLGHMALMDAVLSQNGLLPGVVTFSSPPASVIRADKFVGTVYTLGQRLDVFRAKGFAFAVVIDFSDEFGRMKGSVFLSVLKERLSMAFIAEGQDFRCGHNGCFGMDELRLLLPKMDVSLAEIPPVFIGGRRVSSTRIRDAICEARFSDAASLLGRPFALDLTAFRPVQDDSSVAFTLSGFDVWQVMPPDGVYDVSVVLEADGGNVRISARADILPREIRLFSSGNQDVLNGGKIKSVEFTV